MFENTKHGKVHGGSLLFLKINIDIPIRKFYLDICELVWMGVVISTASYHVEKKGRRGYF